MEQNENQIRIFKISGQKRRQACLAHFDCVNGTPMYTAHVPVQIVVDSFELSTAKLHDRSS